MEGFTPIEQVVKGINLIDEKGRDIEQLVEDIIQAHRQEEAKSLNNAAGLANIAPVIASGLRNNAPVIAPGLRNNDPGLPNNPPGVPNNAPGLSASREEDLKKITDLTAERDQLRQELDQVRQEQKALDEKMQDFFVEPVSCDFTPVMRELQQRHMQLVDENKRLQALSAGRISDAIAQLRNDPSDARWNQLSTEMNSFRIALDGLKSVVDASEKYRFDYFQTKMHYMASEKTVQTYKEWTELLKKALRISGVDSSDLNGCMEKLRQANRDLLLTKANANHERLRLNQEINRLKAAQQKPDNEAPMLQYAPQVGNRRQGVARSIQLINDDELKKPDELKARVKQYRARLEIAQREAWGYKGITETLQQQLTASETRREELDAENKALFVTSIRPPLSMEDLKNKVTGLAAAISLFYEKKGLSEEAIRTKGQVIALADAAIEDVKNDQSDEERRAKLERHIDILELLAIPELRRAASLEEKDDEKMQQLKKLNETLVQENQRLGSDLYDVIAFIYDEKQEAPSVLRNYVVEAFNRPENAFPRILRAEADNAWSQVRMKDNEIEELRAELKELREARVTTHEAKSIERENAADWTAAEIKEYVMDTLRSLSVEEEDIPNNRRGLTTLFTPLLNANAWTSNVGLIFNKVVARARFVRDLDFKQGIRTSDPYSVLNTICQELKKISDEEKDLGPLLADKTSDVTEEKNGLRSLYKGLSNDRVWTGNYEAIFNEVLYRARRVREMNIVPSTHELSGVTQQLNRIHLPLAELSKLLGILEQKDPGRSFTAKSVLQTWVTSEEVGKANIAQAKIALSGMLSVWRGFSHMLQNIMGNMRLIRDQYPEYKLQVPDIKMAGNFSMVIQRWANWAEIPQRQRWEYVSGLAEYLGDTDFTRLFNAQFQAWLRAVQPIIYQSRPSDVRPEASVDTKMQTAVDAISKEFHDEFKRLAVKLDAQAKAYSDKVIDTIRKDMEYASLDKLHSVRELMNAGTFTLNTATVESILQNLWLRMRPGNGQIPISVINEQQLRYEAEQKIRELKEEAKHRNEELKDCAELKRKAEQFIKDMMKLVNTPIEVDGKVMNRPLIVPEGPMNSHDIWFSTIKQYFETFVKRFIMASKSLERLKNASGDMAVKMAIDRVLRKNGDDQEDLNVLDEILAANGAVGMGTAGYQRPITSLELQIAGEKSMAIWDTFNGNLSFGSIYGFAGVVAGFLNRSEETLMVQLIPGVDTGSTNYWLIMGRIEDELKMNGRDWNRNKKNLHDKEQQLRNIEEFIGDYRNDLEKYRKWQVTIENTKKEIEDLRRKLRHHSITTNANHVDVRAFEEKLAVLLPEQRENMKKELQERRDIQMRIAIEALHRLTEASLVGVDHFLKEAFFFYKPQLKAAIFKSFELLRTIPQVNQANIWELISEQRVATRFAALVANTIKAIELQTDSKTFDHTLFRILNNEQRGLVSEFEYGMKRKHTGDWEIVVRKKEKEEWEPF